MPAYSKSLFVLHAIAQHLSMYEPEADVFVQGTASDLIVAIGQVSRLLVRVPKQDNWEKIHSFILTNTGLGNHVVGYLGHGLHRSAYDSSVRNSYHPDACLVVPDTVMRIVDGCIVEIAGDSSKYAKLDLTQTSTKRGSNTEYSHRDTDLTATEYMQKIGLIKDWIRERDQDDRITLSRQIFIDTDFALLDHIVFSGEEKFLNPYNRIVYQKFLDGAGNLVEYGGISPELLVDGSGLKITTNKLSGTYAKVSSLSEQELWSDEKVLDEHRQSIRALVEKLEQRTDDVAVKAPVTFELPTLLHLLSIISTRVQDKHQLLNVIQALVLTGATAGEEGYQKLCETEGVSRGAYYGLSVLFGPYLEAYSCPQIIRCVFRYNDIVWTQVGGAISRLSNPEEEFYETVHKAESILGSRQ